VILSESYCAGPAGGLALPLGVVVHCGWKCLFDTVCSLLGSSLVIAWRPTAKDLPMQAEEAAERPTGDSGGSDAGVASGAAVAGGGAVVAVPRPGEGAAVADGDATIARTGAAAAAAAKPEPKAPAPPVQKFKVYNEQWLEQAEGIAEDFVSTPAMERLKSGQFGGQNACVAISVLHNTSPFCALLPLCFDVETEEFDQCILYRLSGRKGVEHRRHGGRM